MKCRHHIIFMCSGIFLVVINCDTFGSLNIKEKHAK